MVTVGVVSASLLAVASTLKTISPRLKIACWLPIITAALVADPKFKDAAIKVEAHDGEVVLNGVLDTFPLIDQAVEIASKVVGVKHVDEKLTKRDAGADKK